MRKFELVEDYKYLGEEHLPVRATKGSAGYDLRSAEDIVIPSYFSTMFGVLNDLEALKKINAHILVGDGAVDTINASKLNKELGIKPTLVPTGVKAECPCFEYIKIVSRSSVPLKQLLIVANSEGIIDSDYYNNPNNEGHIYVQFINLSPFPIKITKGERIAQAIFVPISITDNDEASNVRTGGHGSTGGK